MTEPMIPLCREGLQQPSVLYTNSEAKPRVSPGCVFPWKFFISGETESLCKKWKKSSENYDLIMLYWNNNINTPEPPRACFGVGAK